MRLPFIGKSGEKAIDPVCHMEVDMKKPAGGKFDYKGKSYYFCSPGCKRSFEKDPEKFLSGKAGGGMGHH